MTTLLFDVPGPRTRRRNRGVAVLGALLLLAVLGFVGYRFVAAGLFAASKWEFIQYKAIQLVLLGALWNTVQAFTVAAVLSLLFGAVFAAGRLSEHRGISRPAGQIVEFFRAVPLLVLIFILYFGFSQGLGLKVTAFWAVVLGLTLYNGSVFAEIFRSGVLALPKGQYEAAYGLGMRKTQVMVYVLLPQAVRTMLPTILSQLVVVLKDTALGFIIQYEELLFQARYLGTQGGTLNYPLLQVAALVAVIYIAMCLLLSWFANYLEGRTRRSVRQPRPPRTPVTETSTELV
jgi:glutamate transport system permease protein